MHSGERWLSVEEIAEHLAVSKESIYRWVDRGKMPAHRVGKQWRFQTAEVDEWVRSGEANEGPAIPPTATSAEKDSTHDKA